MKITDIRLARTTGNGRYLNPDNTIQYNNTEGYQGKGTIAYAKPWVQKENKQLWVDGVCINPELGTEEVEVLNTSNQESTIYEILKLRRTSDNNNVISDLFSLDMTQMKAYFQDPYAHFFNQFAVRQVQRDQNNNAVVENGVYVYGNPMSIYDPVIGAAQLPSVLLSKNVKITTDNNNTLIDTQYISSIHTMLGSALKNAMGMGESQQPQTIFPDTDGRTPETIDDDAMYLVIVSNFGLSKYIKLTDISGAAEFHDNVQVTTTERPSQQATYYNSNDIQLYTYSSTYGVKLFHSAPDAQTNVGTNVYFKMPTQMYDVQPVEIVIATIDGGEIQAPNA